MSGGDVRDSQIGVIAPDSQIGVTNRGGRVLAPTPKLDHRIATAEGMYQAEVRRREKAERKLDLLAELHTRLPRPSISQCTCGAIICHVLGVLEGRIHSAEEVKKPDPQAAVRLFAERTEARRIAIDAGHVDLSWEDQ